MSDPIDLGTRGVVRAGLFAGLVALMSCGADEGVEARLELRFAASETIAATEQVEITAYDASGRGDLCPEVLGNPSALAGLAVVAGPVSSPLVQASSLRLDDVPFGDRLFYVSARRSDGQEIARGCRTLELAADVETVDVALQRVPCLGDGSVPCGANAVCRDGLTCEDRACRMEGEPVFLTDFTTGLGVGAQQVIPTREGILVAWTGFVGVRSGVAVAHLSEDLTPLGPTQIIDAEPVTWAALAPVEDGAILLWADLGGDERAVIRTILLDPEGAPRGGPDEYTLEFPGDYESEDADDWNAPSLLRLVSTSTGALAIWEEWAAADTDPSLGPFRIQVLPIGPDARMQGEPRTLDYTSAILIETAAATGDGAAIELVVGETGECRLATVGPDGAVVSEEMLTGALGSCATVAFAPTNRGYSFLGQEIRRLTPWPSGDPSDPLIVLPDEPLPTSAFGAFAQVGEALYVGWEEHTGDELTSRINVAVLQPDGTPAAPGVPFADLTGHGPYFGFSMTATPDALYALWFEAQPRSHRVAVTRLTCDEEP